MDARALRGCGRALRVGVRCDRSSGLMPTVYLDTHMAAAGGNGSSQRLDSALVARMPEPIDIVNDIFIPGRVEAFKSTLVAALQSRKLLWVIQERAPTLQDVINWNAPLLQTNQISPQDCSDALSTPRASDTATDNSISRLAIAGATEVVVSLVSSGQ